ncbi:MAG: hypothetical protein ACTSRK_18940 [Promethearchaeota archaeon]
MTDSPFTIGFYTIKSRGKLSSNYRSLGQILIEAGYKPVDFTEFPITRDNLAPIDILVIPCPDNNKLSKNEIQAINAWVTIDGGGLLMLSHAGGDKGRRTNLSQLAEQFGMIFENNQVLDKYNNLGVENLPVIDSWAIPHPISENLKKIVFRAGCSVTISGINVSPVFSSGPDADPFETPLLLASENGEGRVVSMGSYEMFRDKISGGIRQEDHKLLALNIFSWLKSTRREQIKEGLKQQVTQNGLSNVNSSETTNINDFSSPSASNYPIFANSGSSIKGSGTIYPKTYESHIKILAKEELLSAFEQTLNDFYNFKQRMLQEFQQFETNLALLMKAVLASEKDIIELKNQNSEQPSSGKTNFNGETENEEDQVTEFDNASIQNGEEYDLPEGPSPEVEIPFTSSETETTPESISSDLKALEPPAPKEDTPRSKEELLEEKQNLENKLNSIKNLSEFVDKKFKSGKLKEDGYEKQKKKLDKDSLKANTRLAEIQKLLDQM